MIVCIYYCIMSFGESVYSLTGESSVTKAPFVDMNPSERIGVEANKPV